ARQHSRSVWSACALAPLLVTHSNQGFHALKTLRRLLTPIEVCRASVAPVFWDHQSLNLISILVSFRERKNPASGLIEEIVGRAALEFEISANRKVFFGWRIRQASSCSFSVNFCKHRYPCEFGVKPRRPRVVAKSFLGNSPQPSYSKRTRWHRLCLGPI